MSPSSWGLQGSSLFPGSPATPLPSLTTAPAFAGAFANHGLQLHREIIDSSISESGLRGTCHSRGVSWTETWVRRAHRVSGILQRTGCALGLKIHARKLCSVSAKIGVLRSTPGSVAEDGGTCRCFGSKPAAALCYHHPPLRVHCREASGVPWAYLRMLTVAEFLESELVMALGQPFQRCARAKVTLVANRHSPYFPTRCRQIRKASSFKLLVSRKVCSL